VVLTYVDSSVALAHLFREPRAPRPSFWEGPKVSSSLLEYEIWNRLHAYGRAMTHGGKAHDLLAGIELSEMTRPMLARALEPWPVPLRTPGALHLATIDYLRRQGEVVELASYDNRLLTAAAVLGIPAAPL